MPGIPGTCDEYRQLTAGITAVTGIALLAGIAAVAWITLTVRIAAMARVALLAGIAAIARIALTTGIAAVGANQTDADADAQGTAEAVVVTPIVFLFTPIIIKAFFPVNHLRFIPFGTIIVCH